MRGEECSSPKESGALDGSLGYRALKDAVTALHRGFSGCPCSARLPEKPRPAQKVEAVETSHFLRRLFRKRRECAGSTALRACKHPDGGSGGAVPLPFPLFLRGSPSPKPRGEARLGKKGGELPACTLSS